MAQVQMLDPSIDGLSEAKTLQLYNLGINHMLSKRTDVYAIAGYARHWGFMPDTNAKALAVGMRHQF
jgi:predicted porin